MRMQNIFVLFISLFLIPLETFGQGSGKDEDLDENLREAVSKVLHATQTMTQNIVPGPPPMCLSEQGRIEARMRDIELRNKCWEENLFTDPKDPKTNPPIEPFIIDVSSIIDVEGAQVTMYRPKWKYLEEGRQHKVYQFIIHALASGFDEDELQTIIKNPDSISDHLLSTSVISNYHLGKWSHCGLILKVPVENIVATTAGDMGFDNRAEPSDWEKTVLLYNSMNGIRCPDQLMINNDILDNGYNEVAIMGNNFDGQRVEVTGVFVTNKCDNRLYTALVRISHSFNLPLWHFPQ